MTEPFLIQIGYRFVISSQMWLRYRWKYVFLNVPMRNRIQANLFCQNFVKVSPNLIIFDVKIARIM